MEMTRNIDYETLLLLIGAVVLGMQLIGKLVDGLLFMLRQKSNNKKSNNRSNPGIAWSKGEQQAILDGIKTLVELHSKTDDDGVPLWYMPRRMLKTLENIERWQQKNAGKLDMLAANIEKISQSVGRAGRERD